MRAVIVLVLVAGCSEALGQGRGIRHGERQLEDGVMLHRWTIDLDRTRWSAIDIGMSTDLATPLREHAADLVINGGFYSREYQPEGLVVSGGRELSAHLPRIGGGIFAISSGRAQLLDAETTTSVGPTADFAIQCYPRLIVNGESNIRRSTRQTAARTALCLRNDGRVVDVYVIGPGSPRGRRGPTIFATAELLRQEGCEDALNLDGGPSTGYAWRDGTSIRHEPPVRGIRHAILFHSLPR